MEKNILKKTVSSIKQNFVTDQVFWENEVQANLLVLRYLIANVCLMLVVFFLNFLGVFAIDLSLVKNMFIGFFFAFLIPIVACVAVKGEKRWVKYTMMIAVIVAMAYVDRVLTFNVPLIIAIPVILSCRYYSGSFTIQTAGAVSVAFFISAYVGAKRVIGIPDQNFFSEDSSEYIRSVMIQSFLPKWLLFLLLSGVCYAIARCGRNMVLKQDTITKYNTRVETELELANKIQLQALPPLSVLSENAGKQYDLAAKMNPAKEVGGDFYDFIELESGDIALMIADVADKGIAAALYMMMSKSLLETKLMTNTSPGAVLEDVNRQLCEKSMKNMFVTVWLGILNPKTGKLVSANAGHEYPAIKRKDGSFELYKDKHGFVLGGMDGMIYAETETRLEPGDMLFVYTDGVAEANNASGEQFGLNRMLASLNEHCDGTMDEMIHKVKEDIDVFAGDAPQFDDTTMLAIKLLKAEE